jgi:predicted acyltransferase
MAVATPEDIPPRLKSPNRDDNMAERRRISVDELEARKGAPTQTADGSKRLMSLDALRGFDMFWIVGGAGIVRALEKFTGSPYVGGVRQQLTHVDWAGFRFYDLIFPLFVFIAGVSLVFSTGKAVERVGRAGAVKRLLIRGLLLYVIGIFYSGGISQGLDGIRWMGVLNRIAIASTGAGILLVFLPIRALVGVFAALLLGYWAMFEFVPVRAIRLQQGALAEEMARTGETNVHKLYYATTARVTGQYDPGFNVVNHFDFEHLPGRLYDTYYDPEGLLSNIPAIATCLLGVFAGALLMNLGMPAWQRTFWLVLIGLGCLFLGFAWSFKFPIIKKLWSPSFVLFAGGWSYLLLASFFQIVDVWNWRLWCRPFVWIGTNAITIYLLASFMGYASVGGRFLSPAMRERLGNTGEVLYAIGGLLVMFLFARALYRRQLFLRL